MQRPRIRVCVSSVTIADTWSRVVTACRCLHSCLGVSDTVSYCQRERPQISVLAYQKTLKNAACPLVCQFVSVVQSSHILKLNLMVIRDQAKLFHSRNFRLWARNISVCNSCLQYEFWNGAFFCPGFNWNSHSVHTHTLRIIGNRWYLGILPLGAEPC